MVEDSVGVRISSKESSGIISAIFKYQIVYLGTLGSILTKNDYEFNNQSFRDMVEKLNIILHANAAENLWNIGRNGKKKQNIEDIIHF